jgi:TfoX N-terminal domain
MAFDDALAERLRDRLRDVAGVHEKKMFGGLAFLIDGNMTVGVHGDDLIARITPDDTPAALTEPGVRPFDITGRPMRGWILVAGKPSTTTYSTDGWNRPAPSLPACRPSNPTAAGPASLNGRCASAQDTAGSVWRLRSSAWVWPCPASVPSPSSSSSIMPRRRCRGTRVA